MDDNMNTETDAEDMPDDIDTDTDVEDDSDLDFEYDENGDIIIPDGSEYEEEGDDDTDEQEEGDADEQDDIKERELKAVSDAHKAAEPEIKVPDERDREIFELRRRLSALENQSKDTLSKLGVEDGDVMSGLIKLAAEAEEVTPDEYLKMKAERDKSAEAVRLLQATEFEKKIKSDLAEVHAAFPETRVYNSVREFPNFAKFGQFRDKGLTPKEAYIAANPDEVRASVATATKRQSLNETKKHLNPVVSKQSKDNSITISKKELSEYRELFPNLSDKEIFSLYRQTKKK